MGEKDGEGFQVESSKKPCSQEVPFQKYWDSIFSNDQFNITEEFGQLEQSIKFSGLGRLETIKVFSTTSWKR